jgi:hypothetical protein
MTGVDLSAIEAGDILIVQDDDHNVLTGVVAVGGEQLMVAAFSTWILVARTNRNGRMAPIGGVRVVGHQQMLPLT